MVIDEGLSLADDLTKLTDGELNLDDALAVLDLVVGIKIKGPILSIVKENPALPSAINKKIKVIIDKEILPKNIDIDTPKSTRQIPRYVCENVLEIIGYAKSQTVTWGGKSVQVYYKKGGNPKYVLISNSYHHLDAFKGFDSIRDIKLDKRNGSYDLFMNKVSK